MFPDMENFSRYGELFPTNVPMYKSVRICASLIRKPGMIITMGLHNEMLEEELVSL